MCSIAASITTNHSRFLSRFPNVWIDVSLSIHLSYNTVCLFTRLWLNENCPQSAHGVKCLISCSVLFLWNSQKLTLITRRGIVVQNNNKNERVIQQQRLEFPFILLSTNRTGPFIFKWFFLRVISKVWKLELPTMHSDGTRWKYLECNWDLQSQSKSVKGRDSDGGKIVYNKIVTNRFVIIF